MAPVPQVLRVPEFRKVWLASLASNAGSWLQVVAAGWLILQLTHSPAAVGALALVMRGPAFVLSTYAGGLADRFDRRAIGIWTFLLQALAAAALAVLTWAGHATPAVIYALTVALGIGFAVGLPAMLALVPALVPPPQLPQAVALNAAGINVARLAGPTVGGVMLAFAGAGACFALNALSFLALVVALATLSESPGVRARDSRRHGTRAALAHAVRDPAARRLLMGMAIFTCLAAPAQELAPVVAKNLRGGAVALGLLLGAMGGGALVGAWVLDRLERGGYPRHHALPTATLGFALGLFALVAAPSLAVAITAMAFSGAFWIWMYAATNTSIQLTSPPELLGRMLGLYQLSVIGPIAVGSLAAGGVAQWLGIRWSLGICAGLLSAWGLWSITHRVPEIDRIEASAAPTLAGGLRDGVLAGRERAESGRPGPR
jgi:MFS family permease